MRVWEGEGGGLYMCAGAGAGRHAIRFFPCVGGRRGVDEHGSVRGPVRCDACVVVECSEADTSPQYMCVHCSWLLCVHTSVRGQALPWAGGPAAET